jgi:hypothetical protein
MKTVVRRVRKLENEFAPPRDYLRHPRSVLRLVYDAYHKLNLETSTCSRTLCRDGSLLECVMLDGSIDDISEEALKEFIENSPVKIL